jgi:hypothetical protein
MSAMNHQRAIELLPWLVNGTLSAGERAALEQHVHDCVSCRYELRQQNALAALVRQQGDVHVSPDAGFDDLMRHTDAPRPRQRPDRVRYAVAASIVIVLIGVATTSMYVSMIRGDGSFTTLSTPTDMETVRFDIVFVEDVSETEMRDVLRSVGGRIVAGPSDIGRYTIEIDAQGRGAGAADDRLAALRRNDRIRFIGPSFIAP